MRRPWFHSVGTWRRDWNPFVTQFTLTATESFTSTTTAMGCTGTTTLTGAWTATTSSIVLGLAACTGSLVCAASGGEDCSAAATPHPEKCVHT